MKKILSFILAFVLCLGLLACDEDMQNSRRSRKKQEDLTASPAEINPLLGVWEVKSADREQSFSFTEDKNGTEGTYKYYDYAKSTWGEFTFRVKEQTENGLTLLIDDGTMQEMYYRVLGDRLYLDGIIYTNSKVEVPTLESVTSICVLSGGQDYAPYTGLFFGMYKDDAEKALGKELGVTESKRYISLSIDDGYYYALRLQFDKNYRLTMVEGQGSYDADSFQSTVNTLTADFGEPSHSQHRYDPDTPNSKGAVIDTLKWSSERVSVELDYWTYDGDTAPNFFVESHSYKP